MISACAALPSQAHERRVDVDHTRFLDQLDLHQRRLLEFDEHVEPATSADPALWIGRVGDRLQLPEDAFVHQERARDEPRLDQVRDAAVDQGAGIEDVEVTGGSRAHAGLHPDQGEDVFVLVLPEPDPERPEHDEQEHRDRPPVRGRQEEQRHREQRRDHEADDQADDPARDLGSRAAPELPLQPGDRLERESPENAAQDVPTRRPEEDVEDRVPVVRVDPGRPELEPDRPEQGHEDETDAFHHAPTEPVRTAVVCHLPTAAHEGPSLLGEHRTPAGGT